LAVDVVPVRLSDVLGKLRSELGSGAAEKDVMIRLDVSTGLVLATDEDKLTRLLRALLDNAVRHTPQGHVVVTARPASGGATLEIRDSGPGIAPELIVETEDVIAGRTGARPPRVLARDRGPPRRTGRGARAVRLRGLSVLPQGARSPHRARPRLPGTSRGARQPPP